MSWLKSVDRSTLSGEASTAKGKRPNVASKHVIECFDSSNVCRSKIIVVASPGEFASDAGAFGLGFGHSEESASVRRSRDFPRLGRREFSNLEQSASWNGLSTASSDELGSGCQSEDEAKPSRFGEGARSVSKSDVIGPEDGSDGMFARSVCSQSSRGNVGSGSVWAADKMMGIMQLVPNKR